MTDDEKKVFEVNLSAHGGLEFLGITGGYILIEDLYQLFKKRMKEEEL